MPDREPFPKALFCPTCRKVVPAGGEDFPFCSDRCRILDLGRWASGEYRVPSPVEDAELREEPAWPGSQPGSRPGSHKRPIDDED